ncbi:MAG TPA: alpha-amylase family protein [Longimicrobiaceae bacterium]|nr:alpha-amylase family protein [Longimicrobiaceae bacterium]
MSDFWYKNAVIYGVDIGTFLDSDGDGVGDFGGLTRRLDYLEGLGVTCLWVLPFFRTPNRDNGYDVADFLAVDPRHGDLGDFVEFLREAKSRGMRVMIDLVVEHTSDQHPWFQAARRDRDSPYRDFYIWVDDPPEERKHQPIFPGVEEDVWRWDEEAGQYYFHTFYHFQPSLNHANPRVREEVKKIIGFWLQLGVDAMRVDAASHMIEAKGGQQIPDPHGILQEYYHFAYRRRGEVAFMGESDVEASRLAEFFGRGDELQMLMNFLLNNYIWLALARGEAEPLVRAMRLIPRKPPEAQWVNFLRNLDEVDLERLTEAERQEVYAAFAPREEMRIYGRGIRRRLAPMLGGDRKRIELAFSLLLSLPGAPMIVYGDEIGLGEDLSLPERQSVRTVMQWSDDPNGGFSVADADELAMPTVKKGKFAYRKVNVAAQELERDSLLFWLERAIRTRRECPEFGWGESSVVEVKHPAVFAHRADWGPNTLIAVHNLGAEPAEVVLDISEDDPDHIVDVLGDCLYDAVNGGEHRVRLEGYGYRWFRLGAMRVRKERRKGG